jgi:hypothetical protein
MKGSASLGEAGLMGTTPPQGAQPSSEKVSDQIERWLDESDDHTVGALLDLFEEKSFALLFIILLGVSALPVPTGGATHVFDVLAVLVAAQLVVGWDEVWIPKRWRKLKLAGSKQRRFLNGLLKFLRFLERFSRPRLRILFDHRASDVIFGLTVILFTTGAFFAVPFSGLDTLPALGVVLVSVGVLLEDFVIVALGWLVGLAGIALEIALGRAVLSLF